MKKFKKFIKTLKDVFIIIGIPTLFYYAYQIHVEQLNTKDQQIDLLQTKIETLEDNQVDVVWEKYKSLKEFSENEIRSLNISLSKISVINDSLKRYIKGPISIDSNRISITTDQARSILIDLVTGDYNAERVKSLEEIISIHNHSKMLYDSMVSNYKEIIKEQQKLLKVKDRD